MDMLVKKEKIFDNIVAVSGTKKEAIRTISRLCAKQSFDDKKVDIAFAIIAPEEKGQEKYLVFLSRLARKLVDEKFIADFRNCRSTEAVYQYVKNELE